MVLLNLTPLLSQKTFASGAETYDVTESTVTDEVRLTDEVGLTVNIRFIVHAPTEQSL